MMIGVTIHEDVTHNS